MNTLSPANDSSRTTRRRSAPNPAAYAFTIGDAQAMGAPGRTKIYELIKSGGLQLIKVGGRSMITGDSLRALLRVGHE